jgi:hypothetical protein
MPSTFEEAIDSVRSRSRASGWSAGCATVLSCLIASSAAEIVPATSAAIDGRLSSSSGTKAS